MEASSSSREEDRRLRRRRAYLEVVLLRREERGVVQVDIFGSERQKRVWIGGREGKE